MLFSTADIQIMTADPIKFLQEMTDRNIGVLRVISMEELTLCFRIRSNDLKRIVLSIEQSRAEVLNIKENGIACFIKKIYSRPIMLVGILIWFLLLVYLPGRVLFFHVEGNVNVPDGLILEKLEQCGISFGAARREIKSEQVKNTLISKIPELQWVGINTRGCLAMISVRERTTPENKNAASSNVGHIVAAQDGIISALTVTKGTALCKPGQAVVKGQILVSGYTDSGFVLRAEQASAEVMAVTKRYVTGLTLMEGYRRNKIIEIKTDLSIQIGKNIVKLKKAAGINNGSCAKIYDIRKIKLPGGFQLPLAVISEKSICYSQTAVNEKLSEKEVVFLTNQYLESQIVAGQVRSSCYLSIKGEEAYGIKGIYVCEETIGKLRDEEILINNGK